MGPFAENWTIEEAEVVLACGEPGELLYVPIIAGMNAPDCGREWAESVCFRLAGHPDFNVRANAILGIAHISRTCGQLNTVVGIPIVADALNDSHSHVRSIAADVADDLKMYLGVNIIWKRFD